MHADPRQRGWWREPILNRRSWTWEDRNARTRSGEWWRNAVIYQVGPWSFRDSDGDGRGDLGGIIEKLDYIAALGVDALWLTPIYHSPGEDYGYDVTDLFRVGENFGTMEEFDRLVALVHQRAMKIVLDMVWNHTSDQHPWFLDSRSSREARHANWYVWADPADDGGPPNNWLSAFSGGSGWKYVEERGQYYFFNFLDSQPDLNWHDPEVREMTLDCARFWLERGVDGLRLDAVNFYCHDLELRDDPIRGEDDPLPDGIDPDNPAVRHRFVNSFCRDRTLDDLAPLRKLVDHYPGTMLLGEVTLCEDTLKLASQYVAGDERLHLAYHSALHFDEPMTAGRMRAIIEKAVACFDEGGLCWIVGNHDYGRTRSYWGGRERDLPEAFYRLVAALLISLPGALCLWQGDELGLREARIPEDIPKDRIQDTFGKLLYPKVKGRDGSRTPMPWRHDAHLGGFTSAREAWLPMPDSHLGRAIDLQDRDPGSLLNNWRRLLHWRIAQPALQAGSVHLHDFGDSLLGMIREYGEQVLLCLFNLSDRWNEADLSAFDSVRPVVGLDDGFAFDGERCRVRLAPWGVMFADLREREEMRDWPKS